MLTIISSAATGKPSSDVKECQQAFLAPLPGKALVKKGINSIVLNYITTNFHCLDRIKEKSDSFFLFAFLHV